MKCHGWPVKHERMADDNLPVIWQPEAHTHAKLSILRSYLGASGWQQILRRSGSKPEAFLNHYLSTLRERGGANYSCSFAMHDHRDQLLYWLIFCSNSDRGLEEMKKAMRSADKSGAYKFSDRHSNQLMLLPGFDQDWLAERLLEAFDGHEMKVREIRHFVLTETNCHQYNGALTKLEKDGRLKIVAAPSGRRRGSFKTHADNDNFVVRFEKSGQQLELF